jgi:hypothetical protein
MIHEPTWPELRASNRRLLDSCIRLAAATPTAYGSPRWAGLANTDPEKFRAVQRAADAWRLWWDPAAVAARRAAEADALDQAVADRIRTAAHAIAAGRTWHAGPTHTELFRLRYPWLEAA